MILGINWTGGCSQPESPLRVGLLLWPPYELAFMARDKGWLDEDNIQLVEYQSPAEMSRAFRNGLLDAMFTTSQISLRLADAGVDHHILYVINFSRGGDALVAKSHVNGLADIKGRQIGVEPSPLGVYVFSRALDFAGLEHDDVMIKPLDVAEQITRWDRSDIDAAVCYEPVRTRLLQKGGHVIFDSSAIPDEIADIFITHTDTVHKRGEEIQEFIRGLVRALRFYRDDPASASRIMAARTRLQVEDFRRALAGAHLVTPEENRNLLRNGEPRLLASLKKQVAAMQRHGLLKARPDIKKLIDGRFVCEACIE